MKNNEFSVFVRIGPDFRLSYRKLDLDNVLEKKKHFYQIFSNFKNGCPSQGWAENLGGGEAANYLEGRCPPPKWRTGEQTNNYHTVIGTGLAI